MQPIICVIYLFSYHSSTDSSVRRLTTANGTEYLSGGVFLVMRRQCLQWSGSRCCLGRGGVWGNAPWGLGKWAREGKWGGGRKERERGEREGEGEEGGVVLPFMRSFA